MVRVSTYADGFGRWHAVVSDVVPDGERATVAANAIATELDERKWKGEPTSVVMVELVARDPEAGLSRYMEVFPEDDAL